MLKGLLFRSAFCCLLIAWGTASAVIIPKPPQLGAEAWLLVDADSGKVLAEHNAYRQLLPPASLTKIMTAYVAAHLLHQGSLSPEDKVPVSAKANQAEGSRMFIEQGSLVPLEDVMKGLVIQSGNDASIALAEYIAGSESAFAAVMNDHAERLGMKQTTFLNATGLPVEGHQSTAYDLSLLTRALIQGFPEHYRLYAQKFFTYGLSPTGKPIVQRNRNRMLWLDASVDGVKTGHTRASGYSLITSAKRDSMRLLAVVMGAATDNERISETQSLLTYGFRFYKTLNILNAGQEIRPKPAVWGGNKRSVTIGVVEGVWVTVPQGEEANIKPVVKLNELWAPLRKGDQAGVLEITLHDEMIAEIPILVFELVDASGFIRQMLDKAELLLVNTTGEAWGSIKKAWSSIW